MAENVNISLVIDTAASAKNLGQLKTSLKDLRKAFDGAEIGSENFYKLADSIDETVEKTRTLKNGIDGIKQFEAAGSVLTNTFALATSTIAVFASENEDLQKSLLKVQGALGIAQSFSGLADAIGKARAAGVALNATLLANPFVLLAAVLVGATVAMIAFGDSEEDAKKKSDELTKSLELQGEAFSDLTNNIKFNSKLKQEISRNDRQDILIQIQEQEKLRKVAEDEVRGLYDKIDALNVEKASKEDIEKVEKQRISAATVYTKALEDEALLRAKLKNFDIDRYYDRQREAISRLKSEYNDYKEDLDFEVNFLTALGFSDEEVFNKTIENFDLLLNKTQEEIKLTKSSGLETREKTKELEALERQYKRLRDIGKS
jgi:hypothetical protein